MNTNIWVIVKQNYSRPAMYSFSLHRKSIDKHNFSPSHATSKTMKLKTPALFANRTYSAIGMTSSGPAKQITLYTYSKFGIPPVNDSIFRQNKHRLGSQVQRHTLSF